jgi:hypothetical protein
VRRKSREFGGKTPAQTAMLIVGQRCTGEIEQARPAVADGSAKLAAGANHAQHFALRFEPGRHGRTPLRSGVACSTPVFVINSR